MRGKLSIRDLDLRNKRVLVRVDFNVPLADGVILDDARIRASLPTIEYILERGGSVVLMSHLGRPMAKPDPRLSLAPCAKRLSELLKRPVQMAPDCQGPEVRKMARSLKPGEVLLLENLRFHPGEERPQEEPAFASGLADLGQVYVNDAFGTAHRAHASTVLVAEFFPGLAAGGLLMEKEIEYLGMVLVNPKRPFYALLGGAKVSTKFKMIEILMQKADVLLIGGAMAFTFFKAENIPIGDSLVEDDFLSVAREWMDVGHVSHCRLMLPLDLVIARQTGFEIESRVISVQEGIPDGFRGVDIGPDTVRHYIHELKTAATVFWNGPMGVFETPPFDQGTNALAHSLADKPLVTTIVGGGDSVAAIERTGLRRRFTHMSTGGGAALEYIEFGHLPGIDALSDQPVIFQ